MMKTLKRLVVVPVIALLLAVASISLVPTPAYAATAREEACKAVNSGNGCDEKKATNQLNNTIANVVDLFSVVVGVAAVIMIIVGGFKYITSGGDSSQITSAKNTILYAIIGLVVVAFAQIIVRFVLDRAT